jgi:Legume-like lectin family
LDLLLASQTVDLGAAMRLRLLLLVVLSAAVSLQIAATDKPAVAQAAAVTAVPAAATGKPAVAQAAAAAPAAVPEVPDEHHDDSSSSDSSDDEQDMTEYHKHIEHLVKEASFSSPFNSHDAKGVRTVPHWSLGGECLTKQSFVRLTPDMPNARGSLWSSAPLGTPEFSLEWKFRISGLEENGSGEHMGLWITNQKAPLPGPVFGMAEKFTGLGIVVDTKRNEGDGRHRDISVVVNNGSKGSEALLTGLVGCNASIRYWEGRDDFNVLRASRIRVKIK